ncbi:MAG: hypothetical protein WKG01_01535 [Kofleriaceae bacterium]
MRALVLALVLAAGPASADPAKPAPTKPVATQPATTAKPTCKRTVVGRGLERKVVCAIEAEIVVTSQPAKPKVVYVTRGGRHVTGRPKSSDRLDGLSHRRN